MRPYPRLVYQGAKIGLLTVLRKQDKTTGAWYCECACGAIVRVSYHKLRSETKKERSAISCDACNALDALYEEQESLIKEIAELNARLAEVKLGIAAAEEKLPMI